MRSGRTPLRRRHDNTLRAHAPAVSPVAWAVAAALCATFAALRPAAGTLYTCVGAANTTRYSEAPCAPGQAPMAIDRTDAPPPAAAANRPRESARVLTPDEARRVAELRARQDAMTREGRIAAQIEIAAVRDGVRAALAPEDVRTLEGLRGELEAGDAQLRQRALRRWQSVFARYRVAVQPRHDATDPSAALLPRNPPLQPPLGQPAPGTQGPLVVAPPLSPAAVSVPHPPVADPATGRVLAPFGDRLVDPISGTHWQRAGRVFVDPTTGRVIPAP